MHRVDTSTAATQLPANDPVGTPGFFTKGNPATATPATVPGQDWFNAVQEELIAILTAAGVAPDTDKLAFDQVITSLQLLFAAKAVEGDLASHAAAAAPHSGHAAKAVEGDLANHVAATTAIHGATSAATANALMQRDASGRCQVAAPSLSTHIARKAEVDAHANSAGLVHGMTQSLSAAGYVKLPGGLIFQWASGSPSTVGDSVQNVSFPITFPTATLKVFVTTLSGDSIYGDAWYELLSFTTALASVVAQWNGYGSISAGITPTILAIGY